MGNALLPVHFNLALESADNATVTNNGSKRK